VARRLSELDPDFDQSLPLVFDFLGMADPERPAPQMEPQDRERLLLRFVAHLVRARSRHEPAVLLLDDAHWIDEPSDGFLAAIAGAVSGTRTLLLVNFRPEYTASWMSGSDYQQLPLRPLGTEDADALLRELVGGDPANAALLERIREHTGGNPFFVEEVVRSLAESGALEGARGRYRPAEAIESIAIPPTVQAVLGARIDRLGESEKHVLQTAAVIGKEVPEAILARVSELPGEDLDAALERLRRAEFMHEAAVFPDVVHAFKHPLTHEVAYESHLRDRRRRTHAAVASALVDVYGERIDEQAMLVAHHWAQAGERLEAASWYRRACAHLWNISHEEARGCCHEILSLLDDVSDLGADEALQAKVLVMDACRMALFCGWSLGLSKDEADALLERAFDAAGARDVDLLLSDPQRAKLMAWVHLGYGHAAKSWDMRDAVRHSREGYALARQLEDDEMRLEACRMLVHVLWVSGRAREAWDLAQPEIADPPSDPLMGGIEGITPFPGLVRQGAMALAYLGQPREALRLLEYAVSLFRSDRRAVALEEIKPTDDSTYQLVGEDFYQPVGFAVNCYYLLGDAERAWKCAQTAWEGSRRPVGTIYTAAAYGNLGTALSLRGEWAELKRVASELAELLGTVRLEPVYRQLAHAWIAEARAHLGDGTGAIEEAMAAVPAAIYPQALRSCARAFLCGGGADQREAIEAVLEKMAGIIEWTGLRAELPFLHELRAQLALVCGDVDTCESERREAERIWTEMGAHGHIERMARELEELRARA
jgi:tetratricopeptide (TPR) repeat protein